MKLIINTASTFKGGGVQVAMSFITECIAHPENTYHVVLGQALAKLVQKEKFPSNFFFYEIGYRPATRLFSFKSHNRFFKELEAKVKPDCVFTTSGPAYWRPRAKHLVGFNLPHHVYPESPFFQMIGANARLRWKLKKVLHLYHFNSEADSLVGQTQDVCDRVQRLLRNKSVHTVSNTFSHVFHSVKAMENRPAILASRENGEIRLLSLTAYHPHKNLEIISKVIPALKKRNYPNIRFVVTIDHAQFDKLFSDDSKQNVINVGPIAVDKCADLYTEIDFVFLPTLLECFSANYPEAMIMDKPILTSDLGFARSVCGTAALYFNPLDAQEITDKIIALIERPESHSALVRQGREIVKTFPSASERASLYLNLCEQLIAPE
jgi:glycosyltransferase involved in cell wall biosynthesis